MPALVDGVDDKVGRAYGGWPDRLYLIGKDGKIAYAGAQGPGGFDAEAWEKAIAAEKARIAEAGKPAAEKKAPGEKPNEKPVEPKRSVPDRAIPESAAALQAAPFLGWRDLVILYAPRIRRAASTPHRPTAE